MSIWNLTIESKGYTFLVCTRRDSNPQVPGDTGIQSQRVFQFRHGRMKGNRVLPPVGKEDLAPFPTGPTLGFPGYASRRFVAFRVYIKVAALSILHC